MVSTFVAVWDMGVLAWYAAWLWIRNAILGTLLNASFPLLQVFLDSLYLFLKQGGSLP